MRRLPFSRFGNVLFNRLVQEASTVTRIPPRPVVGEVFRSVVRFVNGTVQCLLSRCFCQVPDLSLPTCIHGKHMHIIIMQHCIYTQVVALRAETIDPDRRYEPVAT